MTRAESAGCGVRDCRVLQVNNERWVSLSPAAFEKQVSAAWDWYTSAFLEKKNLFDVATTHSPPTTYTTTRPPQHAWPLMPNENEVQYLAQGSLRSVSPRPPPPHYIPYPHFSQGACRLCVCENVGWVGRAWDELDADMTK